MEKTFQISSSASEKAKGGKRKLTITAVEAIAVAPGGVALIAMPQTLVFEDPTADEIANADADAGYVLRAVYTLVKAPAAEPSTAMAAPYTPSAS